MNIDINAGTIFYVTGIIFFILSSLVLLGADVSIF